MKYNLVVMPSKVVSVFCEYIGSVLVCFWRKTSNFWWFFIAASTHIGKKAKRRFFDFSIFSQFLRRQMTSDTVGMPNQVYLPTKGCVWLYSEAFWAKKSKNWRFYNAAKTHGHKGVIRQKIEFSIFSTFLGRIMKYNLVGMPSKVVYVFCEYIGSVLVCFWTKTSDFWWFLSR